MPLAVLLRRRGSSTPCGQSTAHGARTSLPSTTSLRPVLTPRRNARPRFPSCPFPRNLQQPRRWGSKLSNKLFVGKKYVIKHIKTKHQDKLAQEREQVGRPVPSGDQKQLVTIVPVLSLRGKYRS